MSLGGMRGVHLVTPNTRAQILTPTHTLASIHRHKQTIASTVRPTPSEGPLNHPPGLESANTHWLAYVDTRKQVPAQ